MLHEEVIRLELSCLDKKKLTKNAESGSYERDDEVFDSAARWLEFYGDSWTKPRGTIFQPPNCQIKLFQDCCLVPDRKLTIIRKVCTFYKGPHVLIKKLHLTNKSSPLKKLHVCGQKVQPFEKATFLTKRLHFLQKAALLD